jgi:dTDP-4-amino-4,6-dideoxygalactose transaminase
MEGDMKWCMKKKLDIKRMESLLQPSLECGQLTNDGPLQVVAVDLVKKLTGSKKGVLMTSSGTAALHTLAAAWSLRKGKDLVWATQAFTFPTAIQGPLCGSIVVDMDEEHWGPSFLDLEEQKTFFDGVIVTNIAGMTCEMLKYEKWCKDNGKLLLFDNAACAVGFCADGRCIHDVGDGAFISLHETKPVGRGEGGAIFVNLELTNVAHQAMNFGFDTSQRIRVPNRRSSNWRMSDFAAAPICDHLLRVMEEKWVEKHEEKMRFAVTVLQLNGMSIVPAVKYPSIFAALFVSLPCPVDVDELCERLNLQKPKIEAKHYYRPLTTRQKVPVAWNRFDTVISLPFHLDLSDDIIEFMIGELARHFKALRG